MSNILVAELINIETTLRVDGFPIEYNPVRYLFHGVNSAVSGVGYNVAKALTLLGNDVHFCAMVGKDAARTLVYQALETDCILRRYVIDSLAATPQSMILYDGDGHRQINVDLKDIQQQAYPEERFMAALNAAPTAILCNVNFSRRFLHVAKRMGKRVATDVHTISDLEDDYNRDYMAAADILFMSDERQPCGPEEWTRRVINRYGTEMIVIGLGAAGALMSVKSHHFMERIPAVTTRPVVNTTGAGDALFSAFVHVYSKTHNPYEAIRKAMVYASYKVGAASAADGLMNEEQLETLYSQIQR
jgi:ribokinase